MAVQLVERSSGRRAPIEWIKFKELFAEHKETLKDHFEQLGLSGKAINCLVWIPFEEFENLQLIGQGVFSKVFKADMKRTILFGNEKLESLALKEIRSTLKKEVLVNVHLSSYETKDQISTAYIFGLTQNPQTRKHMMVMRCGEESLEGMKFSMQGTWGEIAQVCFTLARRLHLIHKMGILHGDLHSGNVIFMRRDPVYIDVGLSALRDGSGKPGGMYGCIDYFPPEAFVRSSYSYSSLSEVYCLGTLIWQLVTGVPPCKIKDVSRKDGLREDPVPGMPKSLADLIRDCWREEPSARPSMSKVAERAQKIVKEIQSISISRETQEFVAKRRGEHVETRSPSQNYSKAQLKKIGRSNDLRRKSCSKPCPNTERTTL